MTPLVDVGHYVAAGWVLTAATLSGYAAWTLVRGRRLARQVPDDRRRWSES